MEIKNAAQQDLEINNTLIKKGALKIRAINHKLRQQILYFIHEKKKTSVTDIYVKLRLEQSVASQHLAILRNSGFVNTERDGKFIFYSVNYDMIKTTHTKLDELLQKKQ